MNSNSFTQDDWDNLFPGRDYTIGTKTITVRPLSLKNLTTVLKGLKIVMNDLTANDVNLAKWATSNVDPREVMIFASIVAEKAPEVLAEATGVSVDILERLPIDHVVGLVTVAVEVNLESKDSLLKNFSRLGANLSQLTQSQGLLQ